MKYPAIEKLKKTIQENKDLLNNITPELAQSLLIDYDYLIEQQKRRIKFFEKRLEYLLAI